MLFSVMFLPPVVIALLFDEAMLRTFAVAFLLTLACGLLMWLPVRGHRDLRGGDGFDHSIVLHWPGPVRSNTLFARACIKPVFRRRSIRINVRAHHHWCHILVNLDDMPRSLLFYRQQLQWFGDGHYCISYAIFPMLGIGGMQLYRTESPGPGKDNKLTPRITETAKALWYIYVSLTLVCALAYWVAGMSAFDAVCHSFATVAIGGFSTHDASIGFFNSPAIEAVACVFMVLSGINFALHFLVWRRRNLLLYFADYELRTYFLVLLLVSFTVVGILLGDNGNSSALRQGTFQAISFVTTTGFVTEDVAQWPASASTLLLLAAFAGGCAGSTAGGIKLVRVLMVYLQGMREVRRLIHPNGVFPIKLGKPQSPIDLLNPSGVFSAYTFYSSLSR